MKKIFTLLSLFAFGSAATMAQTECDGVRYRTYNLFPSVDVTSNVTFGSNIAVGGGGNTQLRLDVYQPAGDTLTDRPVIIVAFGGSFIGGNKADVAFLCNIFAKMGYVAVAPSYRVGFFFPVNQVSTTLAVMRAMHDIKAAVRYLKKTVAEDSNPYGIDCGRIIVSGISAGAIGAIHAAYMDEISEVPAYMANDTTGLGGIEGNSGTPNYSSDPLAVVSFSGAIGDTLWLDAGNVPLCSIHEENDNVVPYLTTEVYVSGFPTGLIASGSGDLHRRAENVNVSNTLKTYLGVENHVGYLNPIDQAALDFATDFCADMVCGSSHNSCAGSVGVNDSPVSNPLGLYPNPASEMLQFTAVNAGTISIYDMTGRMVLTDNCLQGQQQLDIRALVPGTYVIQVIGETSSAARFLKQ